MHNLPPPRLALCALLLMGCSGFEEVVDGGSGLDAAGRDADGPLVDTQGTQDAPDLGGKLAAGRCCGKKGGGE